MLLTSAGTGLSQEADGAQTQASPPRDLWTVQCSSVSRNQPLNCRMEQRAIVTETGQLLIKVTVVVPATTRKPVLTIQGPIGAYLPGGIALDVDGQNASKLNYETCDRNGCYATVEMSDTLLQAMFAGQALNIEVQSLNRQPIKVPMSLIGFTAAYRNIE